MEGGKERNLADGNKVTAEKDAHYSLDAEQLASQGRASCRERGGVITCSSLKDGNPRGKLETVRIWCILYLDEHSSD